MSFWTGFTTGLAKSVDQGLQKAMSKRDDELSRAKTFWQTRQAQKLDQKEAYDARAEKALGRLIRETGSSTIGLAAYNAAGGDADGAEDFLKEVDATRKQGLKYDIRANLQLPETYKVGDDIAESDAYSQVRQQMKGVDSSSIKVDDPLSKIGLGLRGGATEAVAQDINQMFTPTAAPTPLTGVPTTTFDRSGLITAKEYKQKLTEQERNKARFDREGKLFDVDLDARKTNTKKLEQAMEIAETVEERAASQYITDEEQRQLENARAEVAALQTQSKLIQDAEAHVKNMRGKDLTIEKTEMEIAKEKDHPVFKSFEDMAVYASQKLAAGKFTADKPEAAYTRMYNDAINGALKYTAATADPETGVGSVEFAKQSLDSIVEAARKLELEKVPQKAIGDMVKYTIDGNEAAYYGGMDRALNTVTRRLTNSEGKISLEAKNYIASLRADNTQKAYGFASSRAAAYNTAVAKNRSTAKINYVPLNVVQGAVKAIKQANTNLTDGQAVLQYAKENNLKPGTVVPEDTAGSKYIVWTGTKFINASDRGR
tara:strand:- start:559 stop:2187 length:1629 start_codon:yes stop_codon:yes gene_type:complete